MSELKRYNLVLTDELFGELERVARKRHTSVVEVLRRYIKLGLMVEEIDEKPDAAASDSPATDPDDPDPHTTEEY